MASAPPDSFITEVLNEIKKYAVLIVATVAAIAGVYALFPGQLTFNDIQQMAGSYKLWITLFLIIVFVVIPVWRRRRITSSLVRLGKSAESNLEGYFQLSPRSKDSLDSFKRSDKAHIKVLEWIKTSVGYPVLFLTGRSGVGKSSLLSAYVIPKLRAEQNWVVVESRSYADPVLQIAEALKKSDKIWGTTPKDISDLYSLVVKAAKDIAPQKLLIVVDQFEEFYLLSNPETREQFNEFIDAIEKLSDESIKILFSARTDDEYLAELQGLELSQMHLNDNWRVVDGFEESEARLFLENSGLEFSSDLLNRVFEEAYDIEGGGTRIRPIVLNLLGIVLKSRTVTSKHIYKKRLIKEYLKRVINKFSGDVAKLVPRILAEMVTDAGTKRAKAEQELEEKFKTQSGLCRGCLSLLANEGLVREVDRDSRTWEISHDFVAQILGQLIGSLRPTRFQRFKSNLGMIALSLWLVVVFAIGPAYYRIYVPYKLSTFGVKALKVNNGYKVYANDSLKEINFIKVEFDVVKKWLRRLNGITELSIENQHYTKIDLSGKYFSSLNKIKLHRNNKLEELAVSQLDKLSELRIENNRNLKELTIPQLDNLSALNIRSNNNLKELTIPQLDNLSVLSIAFNSKLEELTIPQLDNLSELRIEYNSKLEELTILQLDKLSELRIEYNSKLEELTIPQLDNLSELSIYGNEILKELAIPQLDNLSALRIGHNYSLKELAIPQLDKLNELGIEYNFILKEFIIPRLDDLSALSIMGNNNLKELAIPQLDKLSELRIEGNRNLKELTIPQLDNLSALNIGRNNNLKEFTIPHLDNLSALNIKGARDLKELTIPQLDKLSELNIGGNANLKELTIPQLDNLSELRIAFNFKLEELAIPQLDKLSELRIDTNDNLKELTISQLDKLSELRIENNRNLKELTIPQLDNLSALRIYRNYSLKELTIPRLDKLSELRIEHNSKLEELTIPQLDNLSWLSVRGNANLKELAIPQLGNLIELLIDTNDNLKELTIPHLANLNVLMLYGNGLKEGFSPDMVKIRELGLKYSVAIPKYFPDECRALFAVLLYDSDNLSTPLKGIHSVLKFSKVYVGSSPVITCQLPESLN